MQNLGEPIAYPLLEKGSRVFSCDGQEVGRVHEIRADTNLDIFDGMVVASGPLGAGGHFVQAEQVEEIFERGVLLKLDAAAFKQLTPPET